MPLADLAKGTRLNESTNEGGIRFHIVTDKKEIDRLNSEPTIKVYRGMQLVDGKLYPPMSAKVNGEWREGIDVKDLGKVWEQADENPELADDKGNFKLDKGNKSSLKARYNPYIHTSTTPLNDHFSSAQSRPELVTVEVEIPKSELTSGYKAEKAKDSVGKVEWKAGIIQSQLTGTRTVILSRWDKPVRIVPDSEVADVIVKMFGDRKITMPSNVVTPSLRAELEKRGVPFVETNNTGKPITRFREEEIAAMETPILESKGTFKNLAEAEQWAKENLQGKSAINEFTGIPIGIGRKSISEILNEKSLKQSDSVSLHLKALRSVLDFIKYGIPAEIHSDTHGRGFDVMRLYSAMRIGDDLYRVKSTIRKIREGDRYYTYEIGKMELTEKRRANRESGVETTATTNSSVNSISGADLLKGVKKTNSDEQILPQSKEMLRNNEANSDSVAVEHSRSTAGKRLAAEETAKAIGVGFDYISREELPEGHKGAKGMWKDGKIYVCAENHTDADDVKRTILHEAVGHNGLRRLIGDKDMNRFCMQVYSMLPKSERAKIADAAARKYGFNFATATEEYLAEMAEAFDSSKDYDTVWDRIRVALRNVLAKIGINVPLSERDLRWILWQSYNANKQGDFINQAKRQVLADRLGFSSSIDNIPLYSNFAPVAPKRSDESNEQYQARVLAARTPVYDNLKDAEEAARAEGADLESKIGSTGVDELWSRTNAATKATLKHQYNAGMLTKEQYEHVRDMFNYYVPMRGFADNTAEDMYTYYASGRGGFTPPIQTAKGRKTQAASPWGYIGAMASPFFDTFLVSR